MVVKVCRAFYSPIIRSQSFSESVPLDCKLHQCFSSPPPIKMGQESWRGLELCVSLPLHGWLEGLKLGFSLPPGGRLELTGVGQFASSRFASSKLFLLRAHLVKEEGILWCILKWFLSPSLCCKQGDFSPLLTVRTWSTSWWQNSQKCGSPPCHDWILSQFLTLRVVHPEPPDSPITVQVFLLQHWFLQRFLLW